MRYYILIISLKLDIVPRLTFRTIFFACYDKLSIFLLTYRGVCSSWVKCVMFVSGPNFWTCHGDRRRGSQSQHVGCRKAKCNPGKNKCNILRSSTFISPLPEVHILIKVKCLIWRKLQSNMIFSLSYLDAFFLNNQNIPLDYSKLCTVLRYGSNSLL